MVPRPWPEALLRRRVASCDTQTSRECTGWQPPWARPQLLPLPGALRPLRWHPGLFLFHHCVS